MTVHRDAGDSGAIFEISGTVSNNATWNELIQFYENGAGLDISDQAFALQVRNDAPDTTSALSLTTAAGQLVIVNDDGGIPSILQIDVPYSTISGLQGDYIVDLVSKDSDDKLTHWGNGVVTFRQSPIAF